MKSNFLKYIVIVPISLAGYYVYDINEKKKEAERQERLSFDNLSENSIAEWMAFSENKIRSKLSLSYGKLRLVDYSGTSYYSNYRINCTIIGVEVEFYGGENPGGYIHVYPGYYDADYRYKSPNLEFDIDSIAGKKLKSIICDHTAKIVNDISLGR